MPSLSRVRKKSAKEHVIVRETKQRTGVIDVSLTKKEVRKKRKKEVTVTRLLKRLFTDRQMRLKAFHREVRNTAATTLLLEKFTFWIHSYVSGTVNLPLRP